MAEVVAAPMEIAAPQPQVAVSNGTEPPAASEEPENVSETLYIQNLNEKIKVDGTCYSTSSIFFLTLRF